MLKLRVKQVIWVKNIKNIQHKKAKAARFLSILKIYAFAGKFSRGSQVQERALLELRNICLWEYTKNLVVQAWVQLEHSSLIVKVSVEATYLHFNPWHILKKTTKPVAHLELCHKNLGILESMRNQIVLSNFTEGKCAPMQVIKHPEHGRTSTTEEQKLSSFHTNCD